jgi:hypothetical protein
MGNRSTRNLIEKVLSGQEPQLVVEAFADSQTQPTLPISQFVDGVIELEQNTKEISSDIDDLIADLGEFQASSKIAGLERALGTMNALKSSATAMRAQVNEVLSWARAHLQELGN